MASKGSSAEAVYLSEDDNLNHQELARRKREVKELIADPRYNADPLPVLRGQAGPGLRGLQNLRVSRTPSGSSTPDQGSGELNRNQH